MQADVDEIGREILRVRPPTGGIGKDKSDLVRPQQIDEAGVQKRGMAHLQAMAEGEIDFALGDGAAAKALVKPAGDPRGGLRIAGQLRKEPLQATGIEAETRRKLPEERACFLPQA